MTGGFPFLFFFNIYTSPETTAELICLEAGSNKVYLCLQASELGNLMLTVLS